MKVFFLFIIFLVFIISGCIQAPETTSTDEDISSVTSCGTYASRTTDDSDNITTYSWNSSSKQLTYTSSDTTTATEVTFSSESDFITQISSLGIVKSTKIENLNAGATVYTITHSYNSSDQLSSSIIDPTTIDDTYSESYTSWDTSDRPNLGTRTYDIGGDDCTDADLSIAYDDANRIITRTITGGTPAVAGACKSIVIEDTYDENYNLTKEETTIDGGAPTTVEYTIDSTIEVCQ